MCEVLGVARSGYYDWLRRVDDQPHGRAAENMVLLAQIRQIHAPSPSTAPHGSIRNCRHGLATSVDIGSPG